MASHAFPLPDPALADDVVVLRPPRDADVPALLDACQDPDIQHFTFVPRPYERAHAEQWVACAAAERTRGAALSLVIADATAARWTSTTPPARRPRSVLEMKGRRWTLVAHSLIAEDL
jgi:RimJ/RimL family protein N-acetyltransferase